MDYRREQVEAVEGRPRRCRWFASVPISVDYRRSAVPECDWRIAMREES